MVSLLARLENVSCFVLLSQVLIDSHSKTIEFAQDFAHRSNQHFNGHPLLLVRIKWFAHKKITRLPARQSANCVHITKSIESIAQSFILASLHARGSENYDRMVGWPTKLLALWNGSVRRQFGRRKQEDVEDGGSHFLQKIQVRIMLKPLRSGQTRVHA